MKISNVCVVGLGAVGSVIASRLTNKLGKNNVQCLVDEKRKERYLQDGIFINGDKQDFNFVLYENATPADLIIIATKNLQLQDVLKNISSAVSNNTVIISLLNGLQSEEEIANVYGKEKVLYSFIYIASTRKKNNIISNDGQIVFGENDNSLTDRVKIISTLFSTCNINNTIPEDIHFEQWKKFMHNVIFNSLSAICKAPSGAFASKDFQDIAYSVGEEVIEVAKAENILLSRSMIETAISNTLKCDKLSKTSMLQDFENNFKTENAYFCGTLNKLAQKHKIKTPLCTMLEKIINATEYAWTIK